MPLSVRESLVRGPVTSKQIQVQTGLSQTAVARQLRSMGDKVVRLANGRSPRYALTRNAFGGDDRLPLSMVDAHGNTVLAAYIRPLVPAGFFVEPATGMSPLLLGADQSGLYDNLPYFLFDLGPQGFLGRQVAKEMAVQDGNFPTDPRRWTANHIGRYLVSNGDELPGNFKFGEQALLRVRRQPIVVGDQDYPALAESVMRGVLPGSSAGGEQPKFTAFGGKRSAHVIVKFSPQGESEVARRWRDILITEYHATEALRAQGFSAAETRIIEGGGRLFLESQRFDRSGEYGRMSMISLQSIDAEFTGLGGGWPQVMNALRAKGLVSGQDLHDVEVWWWFGHLINNTDMHLGNLSFAIEGNHFRLLPLYDMCSMGFAPKSSGEVQPYSFIAVEPKRVNIKNESFERAKEMARDFWQRVAGDERISTEMQNFLMGGNPVDLMV